jgi:ABC-type Na+ efflux pump permease subunit
MMVRIGVIAANVFRGLIHKRAVYVWAGAVLLMLLRSGPAIFARSTSSPEATRFFRALAIAAALDTWAVLALAAAVFLGAASVGGEQTTRTISTVLSRPVSRWEFLVGHWAGVISFSLCSLAIGLGLACGLAWYMGIGIDMHRAAVALGGTAGGILLFAAAGIALGANTSVALAASFTVLLAFTPVLTATLRNDRKPLQHYSGVFLDYVTPPGYSSYYPGMTWSDPPAAANGRGVALQRPALDDAEASDRLLENVTYGVIYFVIGGAVFTRRDVRLG